MKKKREDNKNDRYLKLSIVLLVLCVILYAVIVFFCYQKTSIYNKKTYPNIFLKEYDLSNLTFKEVSEKIDKHSTEILNNKVIIIVNGKENEYFLRDLGLLVDKEQILNDILDYQSALSYNEKILSASKKIKKVFDYKYEYDSNSLEKFLNDIKPHTDTAKVVGGLAMDTNRNLVFLEGTDGYSLDIEKSKEILISSIKEGIKKNRIELAGSIDKAVTDDSYKQINTKVSTFSTTFNPYISRATNLKTALNYIDGAIIMPQEIFSFYKYAGPYNKKGYIFYYEYVGNGVCQIATTVYNAALLGGLEIVKRYPHAAKSVYVPGGLDATVASYSSGWNVDFQFKNTYAYPIYVSAYAIGGTAYIDFWSNSNATEGKTYQTQSVQIGTRGYKTYLHTYKDGIEIANDFIATTWYSKD